MKFSQRLNGFYEEGYRYYIEIRNDHMTVRDYRRAVALETKISYDAKAAERGERTEITLENNVLSRAMDGSMMSEIKSLRYEGGELKLLYNYTIMGETLYTLKKVENGPFDHIMIRDEEFIGALAGSWYEWRANGETTGMLTINGRKLSWIGAEQYAFHVISYKSSPDKVYIVPEDLTRSDFGAFTPIEVENDMLTTRMIIMDVSSPLTVFARKDMLDKITVPPDALRPPRGTMLPPEEPRVIRVEMQGTTGTQGMTGMQKMNAGIPRKEPQNGIPPHTDGEGMMQPAPDVEQPAPDGANQPQPSAKSRFCRECGHAFGDSSYKFCPECGAKRQ